MKRIVAIGECMGELSETGTAGLLAMGFAGDTLNTAWYLRHLLPKDWQIDYLTAVGTDAMSARMLSFLDGEGIGTSYIRRIADKTIGLYYIQLKDGERSFAYWRSDSAAKRLADDPLVLERALAGARLAYVSGISFAILPETSRNTLMEALTVFRAGGGKVVFDPNLRPRLWETAEIMCQWITRVAGISDLCLPSYDDEATWFGDDGPDETAKRYRSAGAVQVVVKNGADPVIATSARGVESFSIEAASSVVDTTAAGDSFNAGYLSAILSGRPLSDAISAGAALANRVIAQRGALVASAFG
ncbi:sugar kinase (plasmid) [Peteryoungia desertarenae]|uniref:Sugar kinase n=1 Tax=Peteryoungia desertarenae TaxID=1813451 RepID=A0ABX6QSQ9_9HYPH|nr:sugar kinase [Peteryoungia desertarenae]QLF71570.1 sugar kinase [Peteryoungia desertarenae]